MKTSNQQASHRATAPNRIDVELLALDLNRCTRCVGTLDHIEKAIAILQPVMEVMEIPVNVNRIVVETEDQARLHRFVSSPTVRINGNDIVFDTLESQCDSCTNLCGCNEGTSCRVWRYRGEDYTEAPIALIVESILREIFGSSPDASQPSPAYRGVPENLRRFFRSKSGEPPSAPKCCSPAEQEACCAPNEKSDCCDLPQTETCGCK